MVEKKKIELIPVLVTTQHRGVFFGHADSAKLADRTLTLERCRCCISWSANVGGFLGLAATGPNRDCKIGTEAPEVLLHDVTSVTKCSGEAAEAWTKA